MGNAVKVWLGAGIAAIAMLALAACAKKTEVAHELSRARGMPMANLVAPPGSYLAYEDDVQLVLPAARILERLQAAQQACMQERFGDCSVLEVRQRGGDNASASLTVRIAPKGVEPMIALAGEQAELGSRNTRAEDLADAVHDNQRMQERLNGERARLLEFQRRPDLKVADMIALSGRLAEIDGELQGAQQQSAQFKRRIDTHKLTLNFDTRPNAGEGNEIRAAFADFGDTLSAGTAFVIRLVAAMLPVLVLVVLPLGYIARRWWRKRALKR